MKPDFILKSQTELLKPFIRFIGRRVSELSCWRLLNHGEPDHECDCNLDLQFRDGSILSFSIKEDGQSIIADPKPFDKPLWAVSAGTYQYEWQRLILTKDQPWETLVGQKLVQIDSIIMEWKESRQRQEVKHGALVGCRCVFEKKDYLVFTNSGDMAKWYINEMPYQSAVESGELRLTSIC